MTTPVRIGDGRREMVNVRKVGRDVNGMILMQETGDRRQETRDRR